VVWEKAMQTEEALSFLKENQPFQDLDAGVLQEIRARISMETYPQGTIIVYPDKPAGDYLRIIRKGAVKVIAHFGQGNEVVTDYRGEGEIIGFLSLLTGNRMKAQVVALEETICYLIDRGTFFQLLRTQPAFSEFLFASILKKYVDQPHRELGKKSLLYGGADRLFFTTPIGELARKDLVTAPEDISIREATEIMSRNQISSLVLLDPAGLPSGIITTKDLRDKVVSKGRDPNLPVKKIQSVSLVRAEAGEHCIEALFKMIHYNIHHLLVVDKGRLKGVVTTHDLMKLQGASPISLVREIEGRHSLEHLVPFQEKIRSLIGIFLKDGVKPGQVLRITTEVYDRLLRKMLEIVERKAGPPPAPYCYVALDRTGRKEQGLEAFQPFALVYSDADSPARESTSRDYFERLAGLIGDALQLLGFEVQNADFPGGLPGHCRSLESWKTVFAGWIRKADTKSAAAALPFFDFRALYGDSQLAEELKASFSPLLPRRRDFLDALALFILKNSPPISVFHHLVLEKSGNFRGRFDLERKGLGPLVDLIRFWTLEAGLPETSTLERLQALRPDSPLVRENVLELEYGFEFLMGLWLKIRQEQIHRGLPPHSFLHPDDLNSLEKKTLKEVFALVARLQGILLEKHQPLKY
jgi:CBS domain-containing protein